MRRPRCCSRQSTLYLPIQFFLHIFRIGMVEQESGAVHLVEDSTESIGVVARCGKESYGDDVCLELLLTAVSQERCIDTEGNTKFRQLIFPCLRRRQSCRNRNWSMDKKLSRQLRCCVPRDDMANFVGDDCRELIFIRSRLDETAV